MENVHNVLNEEDLEDRKCKYCSKVFKHHLDRHIATVHEGKKPFNCEIESCESSFVDKFTLRQGHLQILAKHSQIMTLLLTKNLVFSWPFMKKTLNSTDNTTFCSMYFTKISNW